MSKESIYKLCDENLAEIKNLPDQSKFLRIGSLFYLAPSVGNHEEMAHRAKEENPNLEIKDAGFIFLNLSRAPFIFWLQLTSGKLDSTTDANIKITKEVQRRNRTESGIIAQTILENLGFNPNTIILKAEE